MGPRGQRTKDNAGMGVLEIERRDHRHPQLQPDHGEDRQLVVGGPADIGVDPGLPQDVGDIMVQNEGFAGQLRQSCLLYTSDAADEL